MMQDSSCARSVSERGSALLFAVFAVSLLVALGSALVLVSITETAIAAHHGTGVEVLYAAEAGLERALLDLSRQSDWDAALTGTATSLFVDGPPSGQRQFAGGRVDLDQATNLVRCGRPSPCSSVQLAAVAADRLWGANNPHWTLYAWGPLSRLVGERHGTDVYLTVWVADDPAETDGDPLRDATAEKHPGRGVVLLRATAWGARAARRTVQASVVRQMGESGPGPTRVIAWREVR